MFPILCVFLGAGFVALAFLPVVLRLAKDTFGGVREQWLFSLTCVPRVTFDGPAFPDETAGEFDPTVVRESREAVPDGR